MTKKRIIARDFSEKFGENTKPAIYCLDIKSKEILLKHKDFKTLFLHRIYDDKNSSRNFKNHCVLIADIYLSLLSLTKKNKTKLNFHTNIDLKGMQYMILSEPDAYFAITENKNLIKRYFLDIFDKSSSDKWSYKRVIQYFNYYSKNYWQDHNKNSFPEVILVFPNDKLKNNLEKFIKKKLMEEYADIPFYLSTWEEIKSQGINKDILYKVRTD